jgi:predicted lactoylglutathione lyase
MNTKIFVNLPVTDLKKSIAFFEALGWRANPQFSDDTAASIVISDDICAILQTHRKFATFTDKRIADASTAEALIAIGVSSKAEVDRIAEAAVSAGGKETRPPQDHGFMQLRTFLDLDGHQWEVLYMDPSYAGKA